ncbi:MAG TPA: hypothetical protein PLF30_00040 [Candidatus Moranbacteria bacterium]|jgi:hypothetical protein|nr:hypothetical protein [Candidatus Moranbacteria bacterium]HPX93946.1 hypothetical protein [Candidatus Moranbacteria bacterium]HQB59327.1 hypothetical protein [Candidatus Moranbacteria bacterium]
MDDEIRKIRDEEIKKTVDSFEPEPRNDDGEGTANSAHKDKNKKAEKPDIFKESKDQAFEKIKNLSSIRKKILSAYNADSRLKNAGISEEYFLDDVLNYALRYNKHSSRRGRKSAAYNMFINVAMDIQNGKNGDISEDLIKELDLSVFRAINVRKRELLRSEKSDKKDEKKEKYPFKTGDIVKVKRESGQIEDDWKIESIDENGNVIVKKINGKETIYIALSIEELKEWNTDSEEKEKKDTISEYEESIKNVNNYEELLKVFSPKEKVNVKRTEKTYNYTTDEIIEKLNKIHNGELSLEDTPKIPGLREKLEEIVSAEKKEKEKQRRERAMKINKIKAEAADLRKEYLKIDYEKNSALQRIRKFFSNKDDERFYVGKDMQKDKKRMRSYEADYDIAWARAQYDNKLFDLKNLLIEDAKERGVSDEELVNIYAEFKIEERITMADEHDMIKAEFLYSMDDKSKVERAYYKTRNFIAEKAIGITKRYQKLPLGVKLGIGAGLLGTGGLLAMTGAGVGMAAGALGVAVTSKRIFTGLTTGVGTSLMLEAKGQMKDRARVEAEKQVFLEEIKELSPEDRYEKLEERIKSIAVNYKGYEVTRIKNQDLRQLAAGATVGALLGSGAVSEFVKWVSGSVSDYFDFEKKVVTGAKDASVPVVGAAETHDDTVHLKEAMEPKISSQTLTIEKGSSIEGTLIKYLEEKHPEISTRERGEVAHRMWLDYMDEKKNEIVGRVGLDEYNKMLKDGMVNVKPETILAIDESNGLRLGYIGDKFTHLEQYGAPEQSVDSASMPADQTAAEKVEDMRASRENDFSRAEADEVRKDVIHDLEQKRQSLEEEISEKKVEHYKMVVEHDRQESGRGRGLFRSYGVDSDLNEAKEVAAAEQISEMESKLEYVNSDLHKFLDEKGILDSPDTKASSLKLKDSIFAERSELFEQLQNDNVLVADVISSSEAKNEFLAKLSPESRQHFEQLIKLVPPRSESAFQAGDTFRRWIARVIIESKLTK